MSLLTLTTSEFVLQYNGYKPNNVRSDLKHVRALEHGELLNTVSSATPGPNCGLMWF